MSDEEDILLFCSDLDGTLVGEPVSTLQFKHIWKRIPDENRPLLCYNTGRLIEDAKQLSLSDVLPNPDYIIAGVGTSIYDLREDRLMKEFSEILDEGWDVRRVESTIDDLKLQIVKQPAHYQNPYKSSWFFENATPEQIEMLQVALEAVGLDVHIVYSSSKHLDILPNSANKGNALRWLLRQISVPEHKVLVAGDSGNDSAMFTLKGVRGIIVGNSQPELRRLAREMPIFEAPEERTFAAAVIDGLRHFHVIDEEKLTEEESSEEEILYEALLACGDHELGGIEPEKTAEIRLAYQKAIEALKKTITPLGFAACSLDDNHANGTDVNYRSVWARDGAIAILGSLPLLEQDEEIHRCQRRTLDTLLNHMSPSGQIPANVAIEEERPEYSGVGGIASIDSGMWVVIAFYGYVSATHDIGFLRMHIDRLSRAMDWLSAHDSNNDALLEIPEAGDWTDLFGRSYNVLYDEVLWHRCNVCFGRLLEMLGDFGRGGDYLRWARTIKREILTDFWPTTRKERLATTSFAEQQFSLGDARYLIAQITPFDFSWRCDTFGNLMAFLFDITDSQQAGQTFRFLWGVGINEPYPIRNIYPVVTMGDKDWRSYYTVNLLNLPHHYHNGGIWPLIGGHWVRFLHKLGIRDLALQELYRLAELNRHGVLNEWEFNEWYHGETGRPMGKAYQAWSASEFIRACHTLRVTP